MTNDAKAFVREECAMEARIDSLHERQEIRYQQELSRQRARNGGFTDDELKAYDEADEVRCEVNLADY